MDELEVRLTELETQLLESRQEVAELKEELHKATEISEMKFQMTIFEKSLVKLQEQSNLEKSYLKDWEQMQNSEMKRRIERLSSSNEELRTQIQNSISKMIEPISEHYQNSAEAMRKSVEGAAVESQRAVQKVHEIASQEVRRTTEEANQIIQKIAKPRKYYDIAVVVAAVFIGFLTVISILQRFGVIH